jgi:type III HopA1-like effector protein
MTTEHEAGASPADRRVATALAGGQGGAGSSTGRGGPAGCDGRPDKRTAAPAGRRGSVAAQDSGDVPATAPDAATDPWPVWARPQLLDAVALAARVRSHAAGTANGTALASELYRGWYSPPFARPAECERPDRPLPGLYRAAHAGSGARILADGLAIVDRHDALGRDGWWRTWGDSWTPTDSRRHSMRLLLSPNPRRLAEFVTVATAALLEVSAAWLLACSTDLRRLNRSGGAVLYVAGLDVLPAGLLGRLTPLLLPIAPPLCLPLSPGAALAQFPDNGGSFGARRCHLVSLALKRPSARIKPLEAIADVFATHGIDPAAPYRAASG